MVQQLQKASQNGVEDLQTLVKELDAKPLLVCGSNDYAPCSHGGLGESPAAGRDSRAAETSASGKLQGGWPVMDVTADEQPR